MQSQVIHPSSNAQAPSTPKTWLAGILGALTGCALITAVVWLGRGTFVVEVLFIIPSFATVFLLSWVLAPVVSALMPEGGPTAGVLLAVMGALIFWGLLFGGASAWWYHRKPRR